MHRRVLLTVAGDDIYTRDFAYNDDLVESAVSRARLTGDGTAVLEARHRFGDRDVQSMLLDGADHVLVTHGPAWSPVAGAAGVDQALGLTVLEDEGFAELATVEVAPWASLEGAVSGRALFRVSGGVVVMNLDTPAAPWPQAFFATLGWPHEVSVIGGDIVFASGRYGIYQLPLDEANLLPPPPDG